MATQLTDTEYTKHREAELARRDEFARAYPSVSAGIAQQISRTLPPGVVIPTVGVNEDEEEKLSEVRKVHRRMSEQGTIPATLLNLHPWQVRAQGVHCMYTEIEACPIGEAYKQHIFNTYKIDIEDKGGRFGADVVTPITLARDFLNQHIPLKWGGLVVYMGDHRPGERPETREEELKMLDKAKREQVRFYKGLYQQAEAEFHVPSRAGLRNITSMHRLATQYLMHYHMVKMVPAWLSETRDEETILAHCPSCGAEPNADAFKCTCGYVVDAYRAFQLGEIEDEHHSLRRLTREQLDQLGLKHVKTMDEFRKDKKKGKAAEQ
jgi:hypothetical protein